MMMPHDPAQEAIDILDAQARHKKLNLIDSYFPNSGPFSRDKYIPHIAFFAAGKTHRERAFIAGNRTGKTIAGAFETVSHATGIYRSWWEGKRFNKPILIWVSGDTSRTCRDILQRILLGPSSEIGTGMIPGNLIVRTTSKPGVADSIDSVWVRHVSGGVSEIQFKSYEGGRETYQGSSVNFIWNDEECPEEIWSECLLRTMTTSGSMILTFTPLQGLTSLCKEFLFKEPGNESGKWAIQAGWEDAAHLDEATKKELLESIPEFQREARSKGIPVLGQGKIWPMAESEFVIPDITIPDWWPRCYALDPGWRRTACLWLARNPETDIHYAFSEHYVAGEQPVVHAKAIKARGQWINGVCDPAGQQRSQHDGQMIITAYRDCGLKLTPAKNAVEAGLYAVWSLMSSGRLKVFESLANLRREISLYHRDANGQVVKNLDHLCDCLRYAVMGAKEVMRAKPVPPKPEYQSWNASTYGERWMQ